MINWGEKWKIPVIERIGKKGLRWWMESKQLMVNK